MCPNAFSIALHSMNKSGLLLFLQILFHLAKWKFYFSFPTPHLNKPPHFSKQHSLSTSLSRKKTLKSSLIPLSFSYLISNATSILLAPTHGIYPEFDYFFLQLQLSFQSSSPSSLAWITAIACFLLDCFLTIMK